MNPAVRIVGRGRVVPRPVEREDSESDRESDSESDRESDSESDTGEVEDNVNALDDNDDNDDNNDDDDDDNLNGHIFCDFNYESGLPTDVPTDVPIDASTDTWPSRPKRAKSAKRKDYNTIADKLGIDREYYHMEMSAYRGEAALIVKQPTTNVFKTVIKPPPFETPIYGKAKNSFSAYVPFSGLIPDRIPHCSSFTVRGQVWSVVPSCHMMLAPQSVHCAPCPLPLIMHPKPTISKYQQPAFPTACVYPAWVKNKYNRYWTLKPKLIVYDRAPYLNFPVLDIRKLSNMYISRDTRVRPTIHRVDVAKLVFASDRYDAVGNE